MATPVLSTSAWGDPNASKRAIVIHGITSCSHSWARVAEQLVKGGYYVVAPDLLGHGYASRPNTTNGAEYTVDKLTASIQPLLSHSAAPVSLIIGHSLGGLVALSLLSLLPSNSTRVVLVDPPLEIPPEIMPVVREDCVGGVTHPKTFEQMATANPLWGRLDVIAKVTGEVLCDEGVVNAIFDQNVPWSFTRLLSDHASEDIVLIAGDHAYGAVLTAEEVQTLKQTYPHTKIFAVDGASHSVHREFPEIVVAEALRDV